MSRLMLKNQHNLGRCWRWSEQASQCAWDSRREVDVICVSTHVGASTCPWQYWSWCCYLCQHRRWCIAGDTAT
eukprot:535897-Rhodomonas_salina.1